jgi:hypothetical protein
MEIEFTLLSEVTTMAGDALQFAAAADGASVAAIRGQHESEILHL